MLFTSGGVPTYFEIMPECSPNYIEAALRYVEVVISSWIRIWDGDRIQSL
jgi:hypothetical protein